ncbi:putative domain YCR061W, C-terminal [Cordyceps fumosorosea ARSEF 2679]|uniref:Putative domain YCR061W, C-terminal n=1 Tax=Cordyceps fumosorosea (strain ARSEF 2679) TaxID=1081104 RepID=A0A168EFU8_CORFA|nr:putative domain YCR061W, C-terminal [Cordyceps fumosorosea ARSEF 2679]OAA73758.1 putative domain YCR061W, C-terminal [Cordyceps fumosorosea ARSEF 2679]
MVLAWVFILPIGRIAKPRGKTTSSASYQVLHPFPSMSGQESAPYTRHGYHGQEGRESGDSGHGTASQSSSFRSDSFSTVCAEEGCARADHSKEYGRENDEFEHLPLSSADLPDTTLKAKLTGVASHKIWKYLELGYKVVDRVILPFGFIALTTGIITFARFFEGHAVFGGLAHWIKGGVFFWLGLFNLGRWSGSFAELGWAWNRRPRTYGRKFRPSAEFMESSLILFYGSTNIFLEHLGGWGGAWTAQDLEHIAITVLFIGGGLCGMLIESTRIRDLLNTTATVFPTHSYSSEEPEHLEPPETYEFSLNPIPALVILLLGIMMSSHHQATTTASMVHKQWGTLLLWASVARGLTYVLFYLRPPKSIFPSRPPTELLTSFGLIAGGILFLASSADTVNGMIHYDLDAMFLYTVTMGMVGMLMAWEVAVLAIKGWAVRRELALSSSAL